MRVRALTIYSGGPPSTTAPASTTRCGRDSVGPTLLNTFSDHRALPAADRARFFGAIAETIDRAGGGVDRKYEIVLLLARRR